MTSKAILGTYGFILIIVGLIVPNFTGYAADFVYDHAKIILPDKTTIQVEIADTQEKRNLGLGRRNDLSPEW